MKYILVVMILCLLTLSLINCTTPKTVPNQQKKQSYSDRIKYLEKFNKKDTINYKNSNVNQYADYSIITMNDSSMDMCGQVFYKKSNKQKEMLRFRLINSDGEFKILKEGEESLFNNFEIIYLFSDVPPAFPSSEEGLLKFIATNIKYPVDERDNNIQGTVYVQFIISKTGSVKNVKVVRKVSPNLDKEAIRVIQSLPNWKPGIVNDNPVNVAFTLPINFKLN